MVGEFPELQGLMGKYYAQHDGEHAEVCAALEEQYWPRFAGDRAAADAQRASRSRIADKLDTIAGIFAIGQKPTGTRDPFGLRRAALGVLRTILERRLDLDLRQLDRDGRGAAARGDAPERRRGSLDLHRWSACAARISKSDVRRTVTTEMFDAVLASRTHSPLDIDVRLRALERFLELPEAASLAAREQAHREHSAQGAGRHLRRGRYQLGCRTPPSDSCSSTCCRWSAP